MKSVEIYDNFFDKDQVEMIRRECSGVKFRYGHNYNADTPTQGLKGEVEQQHELYLLFKKNLEEVFEYCEDLYSLEINLIPPSERVYFTHGAGGGFGRHFIYYCNPNWDLDDCGETQFWDGKEMITVVPMSNRLVSFDPALAFKDTSFRDQYKMTVEVRYASDQTAH